MATIGDGEVFIVPNTGIYSIWVDANAGTALLELSLDQGSSYVNMTGASWSADATAILELTEGSYVRVQTTGAAVVQIDS